MPPVAQLPFYHLVIDSYFLNYSKELVISPIPFLFKGLLMPVSALNTFRNYCNDKIPRIDMNRKLGGGADGEVYPSLDDPTQVYKLCIMHDQFQEPVLSRYDRLSTIFSFLRDTPPNSYGRVFNFSKVELSEEAAKRYSNGAFIFHYYSMEKLERPTDDEIRVLESLISCQGGIRYNYSMDATRVLLEGLIKGLTFNMEKMMTFANDYVLCPIIQTDLHTGNILKDKEGNFKVVDFDRLTFKKK